MNPIALAACLFLVGVQDPRPAAKPNPALLPVSRTEDWAIERQNEVLRRARSTPKAAVVFVGDSITQGWEGEGAALWQKELAPLGALNLGVSGDRTEHVLWRLREAPLTHLEPRVIVLLIGTNNLGHGTSDAEETLAGVQAVIATLHAQAPEATLLVHEIFPRGERMNPMRGEILQVNQVLRATPGPRTRVLGFSDRWVRADGTIPKEIMPDFLHLSPVGYAQWTEALVPEIRAALK